MNKQTKTASFALLAAFAAGVALLLLRRLKANPIAVMAGCGGVYVLVAALSGGIV